MTQLTVGSLFSGIGGLELGLERGVGNGCHTVWQVEQAPYCRAVLAKHWPNAQRYEDVRDVGRETLEPVDIICGGFPCQDISVAGRKAGIIVGTRSGLWFEYSRIIRELRPRYVVVENVSALLALGLDAVLGELAEGGYDAEWDCIPASSVGAPHRRDRIFILAYPQSDRWPQRGAWDSGRDNPTTGEKRVRAQPRRGGADARQESLPDTTGPRLEGRGQSQAARQALRLSASSDRAAGADHWRVEPDICRVVNGLPSRVDRLKALGNAVVPQVAEVIGRLIAEREADRKAREAA